MKVKAIITDFDGTLVDTFKANYLAYNEAFTIVLGSGLLEDTYRACYGLRFAEFMDYLKISESDAKAIKNIKSSIYPNYASYTKLNEQVYAFVRYCKSIGLKTAIASTASKVNLYNIASYHNILYTFDLILTGEDVLHGKPNPDVYNIACLKLGVKPSEALVFEDSLVGTEAADNAGANYINVN